MADPIRPTFCSVPRSESRLAALLAQAARQATDPALRRWLDRLARYGEFAKGTARREGLPRGKERRPTKARKRKG